MIRAVYFDFYSVWAPEPFGRYITIAKEESPEIAAEIEEAVKNYNFGMGDIEDIANRLKFKLNRPDIEPEQFRIAQGDIAPALIDFLRSLHEHFLKVGVFANLGKQEYELLQSLNQKYQLFEVITGPIVIGEPLLSQAALAEALRVIGEPPANCLMISGDPAYLDFSRQFGVQTLAYQGFANLQQELSQRLAAG